MHGHRRLKALATAAIVALAATGCGDDNDAAVTTTTTESQPPPADAGGETVSITAVNYEFQGAPTTVAGGSRFTLTNAADDELHELVAMRLDDDTDLSVEELVALPEGEFEQHVAPGPPAMVIIAPPGEEGFPVVGDGTITEPGRYALVCFIPTGADPDEYLAAAQEGGEGPPQVEGGPPHFTQGMFAELTVE
ncbi:MAG TPA: hypothetical protein VGR26_07255 [Acidimicrobiales bacterium]|nr:hypothetical protein [Acidimicrobiales bacterium]